ncbi:MAG: gamma-glutamyltransferase [Nitrospinota bacterium]|nr:gamma-glutamyltransferase [Nitrospinota bacterium]
MCKVKRRSSFKTFVAGCCFLFALLPVVAGAQLKNIYSQKDLFHPVLAQNGMVASQEATATQIGVEILQKGGNAIDAAVAVELALTVTLPRAGNIGGGGFMLVHLAETGKTVAIDYRETAPAKAGRDMFLDKEGKVDRDLLESHPLSVGVPGTIAGLALAHKSFGSLPWKELLQPAIRLAERGIPVTRDHVFTLLKGRERLHKWPETRRTYYKPDGSVYRVGERLVLKDLAKTFRILAEQGPSAFYEGDLARKIVRFMESHGGIMSLEDLKNYRAVIREPVRGTYRGYQVFGMPPPSSGGVHVIQMLNILEGLPIGESGHNSAQTLHWITEAMRRAFADRSKHLGDNDFLKVPVSGLTSKAYAEELRRTIEPQRATLSSDLGPGDPFPYESDETTHFSIIDRQGNVVSNTTTLNFSFGSGIVVPGTGILLNNEMDCFSAKAGIPNAYGLLGGEANAVAPNKRPLSSMSPTLVLKDGKPFLITGSPGGPRLISAVLLQIIHVIDHGLNIAEATNAPRIHHQWRPDKLRVERDLNPDTRRLLEERGHQVTIANSIGSTQSILKTPTGLTGASDPRRPGALTMGY